MALHLLPRDVALAAAAKRLPPQPGHAPSKREERRRVHGHAVVPDVAQKNGTHIHADFRNGLVHASPKFELDFLQLRLNPRPHRAPQHREASPPRRRTAVRETEEVEAFGLPLTARASMGRREATKLDESRFVGVQGKTESREAVAQIRDELLGVASMLEPDDKVIGEADDDHVAMRLPLTLSMGPEVEDVVQADVREEWTNAATLHGAHLTSALYSMKQYWYAVAPYGADIDGGRTSGIGTPSAKSEDSI